jgi:hypothetical protein
VALALVLTLALTLTLALSQLRVQSCPEAYLFSVVLWGHTTRLAS